jgi:hypothetical protein
MEHNQCAATLINELTKQLGDSQMVTWIERCDRFVCHQKRRSGSDCPCEMYSSDFATGQSVSTPVGQMPKVTGLDRSVHGFGIGSAQATQRRAVCEATQ